MRLFVQAFGPQDMRDLGLGFASQSGVASVADETAPAISRFQRKK
ncbi:hypothetical protein [Xylella taiwanensis]|nr:hypothetical protein [Xylella taiwanensis]